VLPRTWFALDTYVPAVRSDDTGDKRKAETYSSDARACDFGTADEFLKDPVLFERAGCLCPDP
jgi:hypothetical protein